MTTSIRSLIEKAKVLIFDFDGTLVDSNAIKRKAFEKCFADTSKQFKAIMAYCQGNNHIPREVKFRHVFEKILNLLYTAEIEKQMLSSYAAETTQRIIAAPEIPGATAFLKKVALTKETILLSSTPHEILLAILERRGMIKYFKRVRGAPVDKAKWIREFLEGGRVKNQEVVFIGDSPEDISAAQAASIPFIGVAEAARKQIEYTLKDFNRIL